MNSSHCLSTLSFTKNGEEDAISTTLSSVQFKEKIKVLIMFTSSTFSSFLLHCFENLVAILFSPSKFPAVASRGITQARARVHFEPASFPHFYSPFLQK